MEQVRKFAARWPIRHYTIVPSSLFIQCGSDGSCSVTGVVAWDCSNQERGAHAAGTASFAIRLVNGLIVSETGSVLTRQADVAVQQPTAPTVPSGFAEGRQARIDYEQWFNSLPDDAFKQGVEFWAEHRSDKPQPGCTGGPPLWQAGCVAAKARLTPSDIRRTTENDFKSGWNSREELNNTLERLKALQRQTRPPTARANPTQGTSGGDPNGTLTDKLSTIQRGAMGDRVRKCWVNDAGALDFGKMQVMLLVTVDGAGVAHIADVAPEDAGRLGDPRFRAFAERAVRAVLDPRCSNLPVPASLITGGRGTPKFRFRPNE